MRALILLAMVFAMAIASDVVTMTDDNFDETLGSSDFVLVEFYAPWCGHCKKLTPEWEQAATEIKGKAVLGALDATVHSKSGQKYGIQGYPTIKVFRGGELSGDYEGGRTADAIVKYVKGNSGPAVTTVSNAEELETLKSENSVIAVLFNAEETDSFKKAASAMRSAATFAFVADSTLFDGEAGSIIVYKHFDNKKDTFSGDASDVEAIKTFVKESSARLFDEIGPDNYKMYVERNLPMGWLFVKPTAADAAETKAAIEEFAGDFVGKMSIVWIDAEKYGQMAGRMGLKGENFPSFAIDHQGAHFTFEDKPIVSAEVKQFVSDYLEGKLEATVKSEDIPAEHTVDGLTTVVGKQFDELVTEADRDVLIEFYAPWCGHCKKLAPIFAELAADLKDDNTVRVAMIDATANDFNQKTFAVQGFPTIFWIPKATREPVAYEGDRTKEGFAKFIQEKQA